MRRQLQRLMSKVPRRNLQGHYGSMGFDVRRVRKLPRRFCKWDARVARRANAKPALLASTKTLKVTGHLSVQTAENAVRARCLRDAAVAILESARPV